MKKILFISFVIGIFISFSVATMANYEIQLSTQDTIPDGDVLKSYAESINRILNYLRAVTGNPDLKLEDLEITLTEDGLIVSGEESSYIFDKNGNIKESYHAQLTGEEALKIAASATAADESVKAVKVTVQKLKVSYDKYGRAVNYEGHVIEAGYDLSGGKILEKEYDLERTVNEFTASNEVASETTMQYNISGAENLIVTSNTDYTYENGRIKTINSVTTEEGDPGDGSDSEYYSKTTSRHEEVLAYDGNGNPSQVRVEEVEVTDSGETRTEYTENRTYKDGKVVKLSRTDGTVTSSDDSVTTFSESIDYTFNEIGQIVRVDREYHDSKMGDDNIDSMKQTTVYAYDILGRTPVQLTETFVYKDGKLEGHFISGMGPDPAADGDAFDKVGRVQNQISFSVDFGAGDSQNYLDQGMDSVFDQYLAEDSGFQDWADYVTQIAGADVFVTEYYEL